MGSGSWYEAHFSYLIPARMCVWIIIYLWVTAPWTVLFAEKCAVTLVEKQHSTLYSLAS